MTKLPGLSFCGAAVAFAALPLLAMPAGAATTPSDSLSLNEREYFAKPGLNVHVFTREFDGFFFDDKTSGIELIHHGVRTATGGAVRLKPTPEQWDQVPRLVSRKVDRTRNTIEVVLRYDDYAFESRLIVRPEGDGFSISVYLKQPLPAQLEGRAGLNLEFLPSAYFEKSYLIDGRPAIFPLYPCGPTRVRPASTQIRQFAGHATFDDRGRNEYVEVEPLAQGRTLVLAPEDPERRVAISARGGELMLLDGRNVAQNGWYVVRTRVPAKATGKVAEWLVQPNAVKGWRRDPVIGFSQVGYRPADKKVAVIELDASDTPLATASVFEVTPEGAAVERLEGKVAPWGAYLRYHYATFDFSTLQTEGLYFVQYGSQKTQTFPISTTAYDNIWHQTMDVWFPAQMDHMFVNEAYRVWHGLAHMDDARQAPANIQHFDGYQMGPSTDTRYAPGEHIPGLNVGGWFDAGDFDIRTGSHADTILHLVDVWELFRPMRDQTFVDQSGRYVDIHRPDGKPDLLQQIEHGALALVAQHRAFGRAINGIIEPRLHQFHHLGDASTQTDGLLYDAKLAPDQRDGDRSGVADDRWAFTSKWAVDNLAASAALAAASRALRGHNDALADECLAAAKKQWNDEHLDAAPTDEPPHLAIMRNTAELKATLQLLITTREKIYADKFDAEIWPYLDPKLQERPPFEIPLLVAIGPAVQALPYLDATYAAKLLPYVREHRASIDALARKNPYGVPICTRGWAGNADVVRWAVANYRLHKAYPDLFDRDLVLRGLNYVLGCHPGSNVSFVSGVGSHSKRMGYGTNRADFSYIAGGIVPGVLIMKPDFPEHKEDWPFMWGQNEYVIDVCAEFVLLAHMANDLAQK